MTTLSSSQAHRMFTSVAQSLGLPDLSPALFADVYLPVAKWIATRTQKQNETFLMGVNGAQGSGKSTFCALITPILRELYGLRCAVISIDDVYHTRATRHELAQRIHHLCAVRGVPGTHDIELANHLFDELLAANNETQIHMPRFDKARDDRKPRGKWDVHSGPFDIVLFEGWCVGCPPLPPWEGPYNEREQRDDPEGVWATWSSNHLASSYQALFSRLDALLMIKVPSMDTVRQSRWLQEKSLWQAHAGNENALVGLMSQAEVLDYVALFARHTEHMLEHLPSKADLVIVREHDFQYRLETPRHSAER